LVLSVLYCFFALLFVEQHPPVDQILLTSPVHGVGDTPPPRISPSLPTPPPQSPSVLPRVISSSPHDTRALTSASHVAPHSSLRPLTIYPESAVRRARLAPVAFPSTHRAFSTPRFRWDPNACFAPYPPGPPHLHPLTHSSAHESSIHKPISSFCDPALENLFPPERADGHARDPAEAFNHTPHSPHRLWLFRSPPHDQPYRYPPINLTPCVTTFQRSHLALPPLPQSSFLSNSVPPTHNTCPQHYSLLNLVSALCRHSELHRDSRPLSSVPHNPGSVPRPPPLFPNSFSVGGLHQLFYTSLTPESRPLSRPSAPCLWRLRHAIHTPVPPPPHSLLN